MFGHGFNLESLVGILSLYVHFISGTKKGSFLEWTSPLKQQTKLYTVRMGEVVTIIFWVEEVCATKRKVWSASYLYVYFFISGTKKGSFLEWTSPLKQQTKLYAVRMGEVVTIIFWIEEVCARFLTYDMNWVMRFITVSVFIGQSSIESRPLESNFVIALVLRFHALWLAKKSRVS